MSNIKDIVHLAIKDSAERKVTLKLENFGFMTEGVRMSDLLDKPEYVKITEQFQELAEKILK